MSKYTVLSFDLSSKCIGVIGACIDSNTNEIEFIKSMPIIPPNYKPSELGYLNSKKKVYTSHTKSEQVNSYVKQGEVTVGKTEKRRRDVEVRNAKNLFVLDYIGRSLSTVIKAVKPEIILVEKNEIFNGVLTSVLLGKVMGVLLGIAAENGIQVKEFKVTTVRSILDLVNITRDLTRDMDSSEVNKIPDVTKRALRVYMNNKYGEKGLECHTDDESDACVVFNYYYEKCIKGRE